MAETMLWRAHRAWCERCMGLVGPPRTLVREAKADFRIHRQAMHTKEPSTASPIEPRGDWRNRLSDPPRPRTLPELMLLALDIAQEDADALQDGTVENSARSDFRALAGYDLYEQLRDLLTGPLFAPPSANQPDGSVR